MIGRKQEREELIRLYESKEAQFVAIYGRRRVGKTYLVSSVFEDRFTFRHSGVSPAEGRIEGKGLMKFQLNCGRKNFMLIVCGSANSWILNNLINNHGGLYGRLTYEIKLEPFSLSECEMYFRDRNIVLSRYDIVQSYMILGGIPYYLGYFSSS